MKLNAVTYLTESEHDIVASEMKAYCDENSDIKLQSYQKLEPHQPMQREVIVEGNGAEIIKFIAKFNDCWFN